MFKSKTKETIRKLEILEAQMRVNRALQIHKYNCESSRIDKLDGEWF